MRCIFCKQVSDASKSVQHIIPESLGNKDLILPPGTVCDSCNQYFAIKIEKPMLEMKYFQNVRFRNQIKSKKGRNIPYKTLFPHKEGGWFDMYLLDHSLAFSGDDSKIISLIKDQKINKMMFEVIDQPLFPTANVSRFLAKTAIEAFALKAEGKSSLLNEIIDMHHLDSIREYARYGKGRFWNYNQRRIYSEETRFEDPVHLPESYEILHELDFLIIEPDMYYFVLVIMGIEYVINCGDPELDLYKHWLLENDNRSPIRRFSERIIYKN